LTAGSIYTLKLTRKGIDIKAGKEVNILKSIGVSEVMNVEPETLSEGIGMGKLADRISKSKYSSFPVINGQNELTGMLSFLDYHDAVFDEDLRDLVVVKDIATSQLITVSIDENIFDALEKISVHDFSILPVVSGNDNRKLLGILTRRDIIAAYNKALIKKSLFNRQGID